jgi:hypothetical protein
MKIYLAARYSRYPEMQSVRCDLEARGHIVTSRWINGGHELTDEGLSEQAKETDRIRFAVEDLDDLYSADCVINFTESPRSANSRGGRHVEFGIALAIHMPVIVVGPRENVFHCLSHIEWYSDYESFFKGSAILKQATTGMGATPVSPAPTQTPLVDKRES